MRKMPYYIVAVFSQGKYTGNQLAVFKNDDHIPEKDMQKIAKEINFSETTFITSDLKKDGGYDVRIFTPNEEIPFAGHPTLGTAVIIQTELMNQPVDQLRLNYQAGQIEVSFDHQEKIIWMKQNEPSFGQILDRDQMAVTLNTNIDNIDDRFPIQEVSTGLPVIIVPLKTLNAVKNVKINKDKYFELIKQTDAKAIMVFAPEAYHPENDVNVRDFADYYGIPEDAATGSANGCLAAYFIKYKFFGKSKIYIRSEQGYEINRPSLLFLKANDQDGSINVHVGGRVEKVAQGEWLL